MSPRRDDLKALHDALLGGHSVPETSTSFRPASSFTPPSGPPWPRVPSLLETFERSRFTFAASWEWDPFVDVVRAANVRDAMSWFKRRFLAESHTSAWNPSDLYDDDLDDESLEDRMDAVLEDLRVYAVVREGTRLHGNLFTPQDAYTPFTDFERSKGQVDPRAIPLKPHSMIHVVWQAEESLMVLTREVWPGATLHDVLAETWAELSDRSASQTGADLLMVAREAGHDREAYLHPDLIMIGGEVVLRGSL